VLKIQRPVFNFAPKGEIWHQGAKIVPRGEIFLIHRGEVITQGRWPCLPLRTFKVHPRGLIPPLGANFTSGGKLLLLKSCPLPLSESKERMSFPSPQFPSNTKYVEVILHYVCTWISTYALLVCIFSCDSIIFRWWHKLLLLSICRFWHLNIFIQSSSNKSIYYSYICNTCN
jgi:hypothetical protein